MASDAELGLDAEHCHDIDENVASLVPAAAPDHSVGLGNDSGDAAARVTKQREDLERKLTQHSIRLVVKRVEGKRQRG